MVNQIEKEIAGDISPPACGSKTPEKIWRLNRDRSGKILKLFIRPLQFDKSKLAGGTSEFE
jgi:hypothetical protein